MILPNLANAAMGLKLKSSQKQSTAVGSVAPHSHDSSKDSGAPAPMGNITGNATQNSKIEEIGKKFFQGDQFANQYASKPPVDPAIPVPPQPDPMNDQYGNMFMQPFSKKVKAKLHKQKPALPKPKGEQFKGVNMNGDPKKYKIGELIDETDHEESTYRSSNEGTISGRRYNVENISEIQEDKKGQFMTTLGEGEYFGGPKPTSSRVTNYDQGTNAVRDTLRPKSGKVFISTWQKNK